MPFLAHLWAFKKECTKKAFLNIQNPTQVQLLTSSLRHRTIKLSARTFPFQVLAAEEKKQDVEYGEVGAQITTVIATVNTSKYM